MVMERLDAAGKHPENQDPGPKELPAKKSPRAQEVKPTSEQLVFRERFTEEEKEALIKDGSKANDKLLYKPKQN